jgi:ferredoxin
MQTMDMVNIKINGMPLSVPKGITILEAARQAGIRIPTLCYLKDLNAIGACRMCVVEVKGARNLPAACVYPVAEGMEVTTNSPKLQKYRKQTLQLILSTHKKECLSCVRSGNCELQKLCKDFGVTDEEYYKGSLPEQTIRRHYGRHRARQRQVRPLPPLHRRLRKAAVRLGHRHRTTAASIPTSAARSTSRSRRCAVRIVRPVHRRLPDRRAA